MSSFLMNSSGYAGADPKFPPSEEYSSQSYLQHSDYYNQQMAAAQHYGYGVGGHNYPGARDPMGYSGYYQQCSAMSPHQQVLMSPGPGPASISQISNLEFVPRYFDIWIFAPPDGIPGLSQDQLGRGRSRQCDIYIILLPCHHHHHHCPPKTRNIN